MKSLFVFLLVFTTLAASSQSIKMKIAAVTNSAGEDILAFQAKDTTTYVAGGGGGGTFNTIFSAIQVKKSPALSTNELWKRSINQNITADIVFEFNDAGGVTYFRIIIRDVFVSNFSYLSPECNGCSQLFHQVGFSYQRIETTDIATGITVKYNLGTRTFYN